MCVYIYIYIYIYVYIYIYIYIYIYMCTYMCADLLAASSPGAVSSPKSQPPGLGPRRARLQSVGSEAQLDRELLGKRRVCDECISSAHAQVLQHDDVCKLDFGVQARALSMSVWGGDLLASSASPQRCWGSRSEQLLAGSCPVPGAASAGFL